MLKKIFAFAKRVFIAYGKDDALTLGAALSYYTLFSIAPLLVIVISVTSFFAGPDAIQGRIYEELSGLIGRDTAEGLEEIVENAYVSGKSLWATIVGIAALLLGATGIFSALKNSLNKVWEIKAKPANSILAFITTKVLSLSFVVGLGFLMLVSFALNGIAVGFSDKLGQMLPGLGEVFIAIVSLALSFLLTLLVFALLFKFLPDAVVPWPDAWAGGMFTAVLFFIGRYILTVYFALSDPSSTYGAAGSLVSLLLWTYYSSQILFLGAEFTLEWARTHGRDIHPTNSAVYVKQKEITYDPVTNEVEKEEKGSTKVDEQEA